MRQVEVVVIGAGPAGICGSMEAAKHGAQVTLIDENPKAGGEIYRQVADSFVITDRHQLGKDYLHGEQLIADMKKYGDRIEFIHDAPVWGVFNDKEVAYLHSGKSEQLKAGKLILAEGAYDRPTPFPGWTIPGVFAAGGALRMVKTERVLPGKRVLLAGTGPLQLVLANQLIRNGAEVTCVLEAASAGSIARQLPRLWGQWGLLRDGLQYFWGLRKAKVPFLTSHAIIEARGDEEVKEAMYAQIDEDSKPIGGTEKTIEVDTICSGYGLVPSTRLSRLCGCEHRYQPNLGGWVPSHDENMETTLPGVFVAGDGTGIGGVFIAMEEGRLAGLRACQQLGHITQEEALRRFTPIFKRLKSLRRFESALNETFSIKSGLFARITDDTIICRCEEVTAGEIRKLVADGATNINEIKRMTRTGMGHCQGRMCESTITEMISIETKRPVDEVGRLTPRPPIKPFPLAALAGEDRLTFPP